MTSLIPRVPCRTMLVNFCFEKVVRVNLRRKHHFEPETYIGFEPLIEISIFYELTQITICIGDHLLQSSSTVSFLNSSKDVSKHLVAAV